MGFFLFNVEWILSILYDCESGVPQGRMEISALPLLYGPSPWAPIPHTGREKQVNSEVKAFLFSFLQVVGAKLFSNLLGGSSGSRLVTGQQHALIYTHRWFIITLKEP